MFSDFVELASLSLSNGWTAPVRCPRGALPGDCQEVPARPVRALPAHAGTPDPRDGAMLRHGRVGGCSARSTCSFDLGNDRGGSSSRPTGVQLIARLLVGTAPRPRAKGFPDLMEPACGAGGMVIAMADALMQAGLNYQRAMHATCIDIDPRCVHMTYLQLSLLHIPAIVLHGNSLSNQVWGRWYTPAHVLGGWRRRIEERRAARRSRCVSMRFLPAVPAPHDAAPASRSEAARRGRPQAGGKPLDSSICSGTDRAPTTLRRGDALGSWRHGHRRRWPPGAALPWHA